MWLPACRGPVNRVHIRPARVADAAAIAHVHVSTWRSTYEGLVPWDYLKGLSIEERTRMWRGIIERGESRVLVAEAGRPAKVVGFAAAGPSRWANLPYDAELYAVYLLPVHQRQGLGRQLLAASADALAQLGYRSLVAWVLAKNPARAFYERLGGKDVGRRDDMIAGIFLEERAYGFSDLDALR